MTEPTQESAQPPDQQETLIRELRAQLAASTDELNQFKRQVSILLSTYAFEQRSRHSIIQGYAEMVKIKDQMGFAQEEIEQLLSDIAKSAQGMGLYSEYIGRISYVFQDVQLSSVSVIEGLRTKEFSVEDSVKNLEPVLADYWTLYAMISFIEDGLFGLTNELRNEIDIKVSGYSEGEWVKVRMQHFQYQQEMEPFVDKDTHRFTCDEYQLLRPFCVAKLLVNKMGGEVFLEMGQDRGTAVTFTLPVYKGSNSRK